MSTELIQQIEATGVGYADQKGVTFRLSSNPFPLTNSHKEQLSGIGDLLLHLMQGVSKAYRSGNKQLTHFLNLKVPERIPRIVDSRPVRLLRPDIAIDENGKLWVTEIETSPGGPGFYTALSHGYGTSNPLVNTLAHEAQLRSNTFHILLTRDWWMYDHELRVLARALRERGIASQVWYVDECSRDTIHNEEHFPENAMVYLFGYVDNFCMNDEEQWLLESLKNGERKDLVLLNPPSFYLESKAIMALVHSAVADHLVSEGLIDEETLSSLRNVIPHTMLLSYEADGEVNLRDTSHKQLVPKVAGYDGANQNWGGRGVQARKMSKKQFEKLVHQLSDPDLPYPCILQEKVPHADFSANYCEPPSRNGNSATTSPFPHTMEQAHVRLSPFYFNRNGRMVYCGSVATLSENGLVHTTPESVMTPAV